MIKATERPTTIPTTRRALLAGAPAAAVTALAAGTAVNGLAIAAATPSSADPVFALVELHQHLAREASRLGNVLEAAELAVPKRRPEYYSEWRGYDVFDGILEFRRKRYLNPEYLEEAGATADEVEQEYQEIKAEIEAAKQAGADWDERHGIVPLRQQYEAARDARDQAENQLMRAKPTTPAGAAALIAYAYEDIKDDDPGGWALTAMRSVGAALAKMGAQS